MPIEYAELSMAQHYEDGRKRVIRIWLPDGYDPDNSIKRYPVLYMHDGQNLFDPAAAAYGMDWGVGKTLSDLQQAGHTGAFVVGVDNSPDRLSELRPPWNTDIAATLNAGKRFRTLVSYDPPDSGNASGDRYAGFIVSTVKPYLDARYNTLPGREHTGIGGSSMGGLQSLYMSLAFPQVFAYAICFSPALLVAGEENVRDAFSALDMSDPAILPKLFFYCGGGDDMERAFAGGCEFAVNELIRLGYPEEKIKAVFDEKQPHNETAWAKYFPEAYIWAAGSS